MVFEQEKLTPEQMKTNCVLIHQDNPDSYASFYNNNGERSNIKWFDFLKQNYSNVIECKFSDKEIPINKTNNLPAAKIGFQIDYCILQQNDKNIIVFPVDSDCKRIITRSQLNNLLDNVDGETINYSGIKQLRAAKKSGHYINECKVVKRLR